MEWGYGTTEYGFSGFFYVFFLKKIWFFRIFLRFFSQKNFDGMAEYFLRNEKNNGNSVI
jgi:hypothetical protein